MCFVGMGGCGFSFRSAYWKQSSGRSNVLAEMYPRMDTMWKIHWKVGRRVFWAEGKASTKVYGGNQEGSVTRARPRGASGCRQRGQILEQDLSMARSVAFYSKYEGKVIKRVPGGGDSFALALK